MKRKYKCTDIVMLTAAGTVAEHFEENKEVFTAELPQWGDPYITKFKTGIDGVLNKHLGISSRAKIKETTQVVNQAHDEAIDNLGMIKTQLERDFRNDKTRLSQLLDMLGYTESWKQASHNQSAMIKLLYAFRNNLTDAIKKEIIEKGVNAARIDAVLALALKLNQANITQESLKGSGKIQTETALTDFNDIYDQAMDICEMGQKLFKKDKTRKELFSFSALVRVQIAAGIGNGEEDTDSAETE